MSLLTPAQIADVARRAPVAEVAQRLGARLRRRGSEWMGSCPVCGGGERATRFETKRDHWVCATCMDGGDVIKLVMRVRGSDFRESVEWLGGPRELTKAEEAALEKERARREARAAREHIYYTNPETGAR